MKLLENGPQGLKPPSLASPGGTAEAVPSRPELYECLASLLTYPQPDYPLRVEASLRAAVPECQGALEQFARAINELKPWELQELFTRTFDMNPVCSLELGWHLFGENYERGLLLVRMRKELRQHGLKESVELPDHLTHVLQLLGRMGHDAAADFTAACVLPAVFKMLDAIDGKNNPFEYLVKAVRAVLCAQFPEIPLTVIKPEPPLRVLA